jgi:hypothetical protein
VSQAQAQPTDQELESFLKGLGEYRYPPLTRRNGARNHVVPSLGRRRGIVMPGKYLLASLVAVLLLTPAATATAQTNITVDREMCVASTTDLDSVRVTHCQYTDGTVILFSRVPGSAGRALLSIHIPEAGGYYTPTGRSSLPQAWAMHQAEGYGHRLDPVPLVDLSPCDLLDTWLGHVVYHNRVRLAGVTWHVWAAPSGAACWGRS